MTKKIPAQNESIAKALHWYLTMMQGCVNSLRDEELIHPEADKLLCGAFKELSRDDRIGEYFNICRKILDEYEDVAKWYA